MPQTTESSEQYTIRRKVFRILGAGFHVYNASGKVVGFCNQRALRLREDLRVYTDESKGTELFRISTRQIIDFGAGYTVSLPTGEKLGTLRRKGLKSLFRDEWTVLDENDRQVALIREDSGTLAILRRMHELLASALPQTFNMTLDDGTPIATYRTHFNPFVYRLGITIQAQHEQLDELMVLASGCLLAAIEGRQG